MPKVFVSDLSGPCGRAIAQHFLAKGAQVGGLYAQGLPDELSRVIPYEGDGASERDCAALADKLRAQGGLDALILTGREMERTSVQDGPEELFDRVMARNTKSAFFLTKYLGALMGEGGKGAIVFVGSIHGEKPTGASLAFSCSMGALKMLNREAALQLGRKGVHSILIELGPVEGDQAIMDTTLSPIYDGFVESIPRKSACTFEELSELVDMAVHSPMLNGADIRADGGFMLKYADR